MWYTCDNYEKTVMDMTIRSLLSKYKELILYGLWGVATTIVNFGVFFLCTRVWDIHYVIANVLAWTIAVLFAFWSNKCFVFESKSWAPRIAVPEFLKFTGARFFSGLLETGLLWLCVELLHFHDGVTKVAVSVLVVIANYIFSKLFIFHKGE